MAVVEGMETWRNMFLGREFRNRARFFRESEMKEVTLRVLSTGIDISGIDSADQLVSSLSRGQKQAVAIARAVYFRKSFLLLDEPTSALSVRATNKLLQYIAGCAKRERRQSLSRTKSIMPVRSATGLSS